MWVFVGICDLSRHACRTADGMQKENQNENHAELEESDEETLRDDDEGGEEGEDDSGEGNGADEHESRSLRAQGGCVSFIHAAAALRGNAGCAPKNRERVAGLSKLSHALWPPPKPRKFPYRHELASPYYRWQMPEKRFIIPINLTADFGLRRPALSLSTPVHPKP